MNREGERERAESRSPRTLAQLIRPLEFVLEGSGGTDEAGDEAQLSLLTMRLADPSPHAVATIWRESTAPDDQPWSRSTQPSRTIVIDVDGDQENDLPSALRPSLLAGALAPSWCEIDDRDLETVLETVVGRSLLLVRVDGPVEPSDVLAMSAAARRGERVLDAEVRATAAMRTPIQRSQTRFDVSQDAPTRPGRADDLLRLEVDHTKQIHLAAGAALAHYVARLRGGRAGDVPSAQPAIMARLFSVARILSVRPIETEVYSTSVDIGVSASPLGQPQPALTSVIYDLFSGTWHDEP